MATSLLALLDDISTVLDDVALLTKVAARKTAGVLGDDLALNAEQVSGVRASRELPVVWGVFKGSLLNKLILVPAALSISAVAPWAIAPLMMLGGLYLAFEGFEKVAHRWLHRALADDAKQREPTHAGLTAALLDPEADLVVLERDKIKGAIRTDFVLSAEIVVITLGTVAAASFPTQVLVLTGVALLMTVGVYGLVAGIVKLDDAGLLLSRRQGATPLVQVQRVLGRGILVFAPYLMKTLAIAGTVAMFLVGGGILGHGIPGLHDLVHHLAEAAARLPAIGGILGPLAPLIADALIGILAGAAAVALVGLIRRAPRDRHA